MSVGVLLLAVVVDLAFGDPPNRFHPVAWLGRALAVGRRLLCHGSPPALLFGGALVVVGVAALAALGGALVDAMALRLGPVGLALEAVALACLFSLRGLVVAARRVAAALARGDLDEARALLARDLVSRPTAGLDAGHVASATVESVAENLTDSFLAPACFFLVAGLPGVAAYRAINTADAMFGYREGALEHFGKVAARLDDLLNLLPARLAGCAIVGGAALAGVSARRALAVMRRDRRRTASPNAGWTMAAMAGALGVALEKPGAYRLGEGSPPPAEDIERSIRVFARASALGGLSLIAVAGVVAGIWP
ncbi:MAG: adenosylcobinamide-phosphate synthase CbiB [candidate division NC10 bacterium]